MTTLPMSPASRERIARPDIDSLLVIDGLASVAKFCLEKEKPNNQPRSNSARMMAGGLVVAVECKLAPGVYRDTESWVSQVRIVQLSKRCGSPQSVSGLSVELSYGADIVASYPSTSPLYASYAFNEEDNQNHRIGRTDAYTTRVGELDELIAQGRPDSPDTWLGFYLADVVHNSLQQTK